MTALVFTLVAGLACVTDGDGAPPGMTPEQEEAWAWANLRPIVVESTARRPAAKAPAAKKAAGKKPPPPAPVRPARRPANPKR